MPLFIYDVIQKAKDVFGWLTAPARQVVAFVENHPKSALAIFAALLYLAWRF